MAKNKSWQIKYEKINEIGEGGNAKVYRVNKAGKEYALKDLYNRTVEKKARFIDEIDIMSSNCNDIEGIIPIIDFSREDYWYTMPIAKNIFSYIIEYELNIENIIKEYIQLCETLEKLHEKDLCHRDIKPSNIYFYKNRFYLGDFGLVEIVDNENEYTRSDRGLGAVFTIAPEMKRNPKEADGKKADVFSLAKTLWMLLFEDEKGFDGRYDYLDKSHSLRFNKSYKDVHLVEIEELIRDSTNNSPDKRPKITEFKNRLENWLGVFNDINKEQESEWKFLEKQIFGAIIPTSAAWSDRDSIVDVLNIIGITPVYNHLFFHDIGGLDFSHAEIAEEDGCIKIFDSIGYCCILKPKKLCFEGFLVDYKWNYFLLELDELSPILSNSDEFDFEELVEDVPGNYVSSRDVIYGVYDYDSGKLLPEGYRVVNRYIRGKFLIVMKMGPYNKINATYDGRHGDCSTYEFRKYINKLASELDKIKSSKNINEMTERIILNSKKFSKNVFKQNIYEEFGDSNCEYRNNSKMCKEFIEKNMYKWDFTSIILNQCYSLSKNNSIKFIFIFNNSDFFQDFIDDKFNCLCIDGYIRKLNYKTDPNCYTVYDREIAINVLEKINSEIKKIISNENHDFIDMYDEKFEIEFLKNGKPNHLFSKSEIEYEMRNADDRKTNQLIIDENGYARVVECTPIKKLLYPVRNESFNSYNNYVGKYSSLSTLDDNYINMLDGWLAYLKTGKTQYIDINQKECTEKELISEIKKLY